MALFIGTTVVVFSAHACDEKCENVGPQQDLLLSWTMKFDDEDICTIIPGAKVFRESHKTFCIDCASRPERSLNCNGPSAQLTRIEGAVSVPGAKTSKEVAAGFLRKFHELLNVDENLNDLRITGISKFQGQDFFQLQRLYKGFPVLKEGLAVKVSSGLKVTYVSSDIKLTRLSGDPMHLPLTDAHRRRAYESLGLNCCPYQDPRTIEKMVAFDDSGIHSIYRLWFKEVGWDVFFDPMQERTVVVSQRIGEDTPESFTMAEQSVNRPSP